jgi:hypothetical protein
MPKNSTFTRTIVIVTDGPARPGFQGLGSQTPGVELSEMMKMKALAFQENQREQSRQHIRT